MITPANTVDLPITQAAPPASCALPGSTLGTAPAFLRLRDRLLAAQLRGDRRKALRLLGHACHWSQGLAAELAVDGTARDAGEVVALAQRLLRRNT
jgi:hypothetical protein